MTAVSLTADDAIPASERTILGHPVGLFVCFFTEMWERFSFYGMKGLLLLYLTKYHLFSDEHGYNLLGAYGGLVYAVPVVGGLLADRYLGMRKAVTFGAILLVLGHLGMAFEGHAATLVNGVLQRDESALQVFYFSLALIIMGVGFLKPNISTIVGKLYPENDPRRESGFTLFFAGINLGATIAPLFCGWLGETYGWGYGFGAAGIGMLAGLFVFLWGQKHLQGHAEPREPARLRERVLGPLSREHLIYLGAIGGLFVIWGLIQAHSIVLKLVPDLFEPSPVLLAMHTVSVLLVGGVAWFMAKHCNKIERQQMVCVILFILGGLLFYTVYEQTYGSWVLFSDRVMNRPVWEIPLPGVVSAILGIFSESLGALEYLTWKVTASQLTSLGAIGIIALTPVFTWAWPALDRVGLNPSKPAKTGLGLIAAGCAFLVLVWSAQHPEANGLTGFWWFVLAYFVLALGEIILSPIGLDAVTQLSVARVVSLMMGGWWLGTSYAEVLAAKLGAWSSIELPENGALNVAEALAKYEEVFLFSAKMGIGAGVLFLLITPLMKRWMHGVK